MTTLCYNFQRENRDSKSCVTHKSQMMTNEDQKLYWASMWAENDQTAKQYCYDFKHISFSPFIKQFSPCSLLHFLVPFSWGQPWLRML